MADRATVRPPTRHGTKEPPILARGLECERALVRVVQAHCIWRIVMMRHRLSRNLPRSVSGAGENVKLLNPRDVDACASVVKSDGLKLGLFSPSEVCVDPREIIAGLPEWLSRCFGVVFEYRSRDNRRRKRRSSSQAAPNGRPVASGSAAVTSWDSFIRAAMHDAGLVRCKLQMMRSQPVGNDWRIGPMLAAGLTLRHYESFQNSPSLPAL